MTRNDVIDLTFAKTCAFLVTVATVLFATLCCGGADTAGKTPATAPLAIVGDAATMSGTPLTAEHVAAINERLRGGQEARVEVYEKPGFVIAFQDGGRTVRYSVFADYVYVGDYLDAWQDRMSGRTSRVYRVGSELWSYLSSLDQSPAQ